MAWVALAVTAVLPLPTNRALAEERSAEAAESDVSDEPETPQGPIRVLYVTGGANHDYEAHARILTEGISARSGVEISWTVVHQGQGRSDVRIPLFESEAWADDHDVVLHHYAFARVGDGETLDRILRPHREGLPAVLLHATLPSFRAAGESGAGGRWTEFCGAEYGGFGAAAPLLVVPKRSPEPALGGVWEAAGEWSTPMDELYLVDRVLSGVEVLADASAAGWDGSSQPVAWRHEYGPEAARVFVISFGDGVQTVAEGRYLDLVARGLLWAVDRLSEESFVKIPHEGREAGETGAAALAESPDLLRLGRSATTGGEARASSIDASGTALPSFVLDGDPLTGWRAAEPGPASLRIEFAESMEVASVALQWEGRAPERYEIEGEATNSPGVWERVGADGAADLGGGAAFLDLAHPRDLSGLRLTVPSTRAGERVGVRAVAAYGTERPPPGALLARHEPQGALRTVFPAGGVDRGGASWRLRPGWGMAFKVEVPREGGAILAMAECASGDVFLARGDAETGLVAAVDLLTFGAAGSAGLAGLAGNSRFLEGRAGMGGIAWDGEWLYLLEGGELVAFRGFGGSGAADERFRVGRVFSLPSGLETPPRLGSLQLGADGMCYALWDHAESLEVLDREGRAVEIPARAIVRFGLDGSGFESVVEAEGAAPSSALLVVDERMRAFLAGGAEGEGASGPGVSMMSLGGLTALELRSLAAGPMPERIDPALALHGERELMVASADLEAFGSGSPGLHLLGRLEGGGAGGQEADELAIIAARPYRGGILVLSEEGGAALSLRLFVPEGRGLETPVDFDALPDGALPPLLGSEGAVGREAVFEILRRKRLDGSVAFDVLRGEGRSPTATLRALSLLRLAQHPAAFDAAVGAAGEGREALAFHVLAGQEGFRNHPVFAELMRARDPALTVAMLEAALRSGTEVAGLEELVFGFAASGEAGLAEAASRFLVRREAAATCFAALDDLERRESWAAAFGVLAAMPLAEVAEGLRERLAATSDPEFRQRALSALVRLIAREDGGSLEEESGRERAAVVDDLFAALRHPRVDRETLFAEMRKAGIAVEDPELLVGLAKEHLAMEPEVLSLLERHAALPPPALDWLGEIAASRARDERLKESARRLLERAAGQEASASDSRAAVARETSGDALTGEALAAALHAAVADPERGWELLSSAGCIACHNIHGEGPERAPDLVAAAAGFGLGEFAEAVLHPSGSLGQGFETWDFELDNGLRFDAVIERQDEVSLTLRDTAWNAFTLPRERVRLVRQSERSLMPTGVAEGMDATAFASLHAYLRRLGGE